MLSRSPWIPTLILLASLLLAAPLGAAEEDEGGGESDKAPAADEEQKTEEKKAEQPAEAAPEAKAEPAPVTPASTAAAGGEGSKPEAEAKPAAEPAPVTPASTAAAGGEGSKPEAEAEPAAEPLPSPEPPPEEDDEGWSKDFYFDGEYRFRAIHLDAFPLDAEGHRFDQSDYAEQRLRLQPRVELGDTLGLHVEFDLLHGLTGGDINGMGLSMPRPGYDFEDFVRRPRNHLDGFSFGNFAPRQLWLRYRTPIGELRVGQMQSDWGLGLVANGGNRKLDFGDAYNGDLSERLLFATKPLLLFSDADWADNLLLVLGGGVVFQDDHGSLLDGDLAYEGLGALRYAIDKLSHVGLYVAYRNLKAESPPAEGSRKKELAVWAIDLTARYGVDIESIGAELSAEVELVYVVGDTTMTRNLAAVDGLDISQFGAALEADLDFGPIAIRLMAGVATGDDNPFDDTVNNFRFDPNYGVGLLMFREVLAWQSARSAILLTDPDLSGYPQEGLTLLPTNGSVTNAGYLMPEIILRPVDNLEVRTGLLWAKAMRKIVDPHNANTLPHVGGWPVTYLGGEGGRDYGLELDSRIDYTVDLVEYLGLKLKLGLEQASLFPGDAFQRADGSRMDPVHLVRGRAEVLW